MYKIYTRILCWPDGLMPKILMIMRLTTVLLIATIMQVSAATFAQKLTYHQKNATVSQIFKEIKRQTGYNVLWFSKEFDANKRVNVSFENAELKDVLDKTLQGLGVTFSIEDKTVVLKKRGQSLIESVLDYLKRIDVRGRVTDRNGNPMVGASVTVKGISKGTTTDKNGVFLISGIEENAVLQIAYIGYEGKELSATPDLGVIVLEMSTSKLDEVQIQAYGTTSRRLSTGNITTVKAEEIAKQPVNNLLLTLQGKVPGMSIVQTTGMPGAAPTVRIRGTNSIGAGLSPLFIVDGVPIPESQASINGGLLGVNGISGLESLNPNDIESVDILKDADATAIYGSRGANGVVLITTKKGKGGPVEVNINAYTGFSKVQHFVDLLDVHQYNAMRREAMRNTNTTPTAGNSPDLFSYDTVNVHNWQKELIGGTGLSQDANISVSGGTGGTTIYVNAGYHKQSSVYPGEADDVRKSARFNANHTSQNRKLNLGLISGYSISTLNLQSTDLTSFIDMPPSYPLYTDTGLPNFSGARGFPLAYTMQPYFSETKNYNGHANLSYEPLSGLAFKIDAGYNSSINDQTQKTPLISLDPTSNSSGKLQTGIYKNNTWIAEPQITFNKRFGKGKLDLLAGTSFQKTVTNYINGEGTNFVNEALLDNLSSAQTVSITTGDNIYTYTSVFGRAAYNYSNKYLANLSFRRDGSSRFGPNKRFGNFGALGLGWIFSKEAAIKKILPFLSYGKLRASIGVNGNDQVGDYQYISTYTLNPNGYQGSALFAETLANKDFRWEENKKLEAAIDLGFFEDRILGSAAFFRNRTNNQLIQYSVSTQTGYGSYLANFPALLQNQGWEFTLNTTNINTANFSWKTMANAAFSKNKLIEFPGIEQTSYFSQYVIGESITLSKGYVFETLSNTGVPVYKDLNGDGVVDATNDRIILGNRDPFTGGLSNEFRYRSFELSFFIDYSRFSNYNPAVAAARSGSLGTNRTVKVLDRWQKPGDELLTNTPKFSTSAATYNARNYLQSDINWREADIFRLRNISFSYHVPSKYADKLNLKNARVFFQAQNLWTSGDHSTLLDPETGYSTLPPLRTLTFGMNLTF